MNYSGKIRISIKNVSFASCGYMYAVWLLPEERDAEYLNRIIKNLSRLYGAPEFSSHVTVYGLVNAELELVEDAVKSSTINLKPFTVRKSGIGYSGDIWKSLFINIELTPELRLVNGRLTQNLVHYHEYEFFPHISLIYKKIDEYEKRKIIDRMKIKKEFIIDKIGILKFSENIQDWEIITILRL